MERQSFFDLLAVFLIAIIYLATQLYVFLFPAYDLTTFLAGAVVPLVASFLISVGKGSKILLYASLAYFWALVDDAPVYLDSVLTWPEVTRFNPAAPHLFLELVYHLLTAAFLVLTIREAIGGKAIRQSRKGEVVLLTVAAFGLAYFQNIPIYSVQAIVETQWYQLDLIEHLLSVFALYLAVRVSGNGSAQPPIQIFESTVQDQS